PQHRRLPRGVHGRDRQEARRAAQAEVPAHRRLLVSTRRHADRRVLAGGGIAFGSLAAGPGRRALPGAWLAWGCSPFLAFAIARSRYFAARRSRSGRSLK